MNLSELASDLKPYVVKWIEASKASKSGFAPSPHDLSSGHHTGVLADSQGPQFLLTDGTRQLNGNLAVIAGATLDGVDLSDFKSVYDTHLTGDSHQDYVHKTIARVITAVHTFNPGSAGAPFILGANAQGQVITGLLADQLNKSVIAGTGLTGGGLLTASKTLSVNLAAAFSWTGEHTFTQTTFASTILPRANDAYDLGSPSMLWRKGWLSELDTILFAQNTITLLGGLLVVSKGEGKLASTVLSGSTTIDFGQAMTVNDFILLRGNGQVEYIQIVSLYSGTTYNVTRNLDGSGPNTWYEGTPYAILGYSGSGRIELNAYDTPRMSILQQGTAYNQVTELLRLGDMNGAYDFTSEEYGIGIGNFSAGNYLRYGTAKGFLLKAGNGAVSMGEDGLSILTGSSPTPAGTNSLSFIDTSTGSILSQLYSFVELMPGSSVSNWISKLVPGANDGSMTIHLDASSPSSGTSSAFLTVRAEALPSAGVNAGSTILQQHDNFYSKIELSVYRTGLGSTYATLTTDGLNLNAYTGAKANIKLLGGIVSGTGEEIPGNGEIISDRNRLRTVLSNPTFSSIGMSLWSRNNSLYALNQANVPTNLSSVGSAGYLLPINFYLASALWLTTGFNYGPSGAIGWDLGKNDLNLTNYQTGLYQKGNPGATTGATFDGTTSYLYVPLSLPINHASDTSFGAWVYLDSVTRDHGIVRAGTTAVSWQIAYRYISAANRYFEFGYWDTGGVWRVIKQQQYSTIGWVYIGISESHGSPTNNLQCLAINDQIYQVFNTGFPAPRNGTGNFQLGVAGTGTNYFLLGKMAGAWLAGNPIQHHIDYYNATRGYFQY